MPSWRGADDDAGYSRGAGDEAAAADRAAPRNGLERPDLDGGIRRRLLGALQKAKIHRELTRGTGPVTGYQTRCLDDSGSGTANGNPIVLWSCSGSANQNWALPGDGTVHVLGKCMDVTHSATTAGTKIQLYTCNGSGAQQWRAQADGSVVNPESGMCLDDPGFSLSGAQLEIWTCNGGANQKWNLPA